MRFSDVKGLSVMGAEGRYLGSVTDVELEKSGEQWLISGLVIEVKQAVAQELGLQKSFWKHATVVIPARYVRSISDAIMLSVGLDKLSQHLEMSRPHEEVKKEETATA